MKPIFFFPLLLVVVSLSAQQVPPPPLPDTVPAFTEKKIRFSGFQWTIRQTRQAEGPGPNYFSDSTVRVDSLGRLHLMIRKNEAGQWQCSEVTSDLSFEYGTYTFEVSGAIDRMDRNVVLGLFNYSGNDGLDEMDIEFARWGNAASPNLNYTVWPAKKGIRQGATVHEFSLKDSISTHFFRRSADSVVCRSFEGPATDKSRPVFASTFARPVQSISRLAMPVHLNCWLFEGKPPADGKEVEVIVRRFLYKP